MGSKLPSEERARLICEDVAARLRLADEVLAEYARGEGTTSEELPAFADAVRKAVLELDVDAWLAHHEKRERLKPFRRAKK
jgi:hypothetical protein